MPLANQSGRTYPPLGELFGPKHLCLNAYASKSAHLTHKIPMFAPLGIYTYNAFVGPYPTILGEDHFVFTVTATSEAIGPDIWEVIVDEEFDE